MLSLSRPSFITIKVFIRARVFNMNGANIIASSLRVSLGGFPYLPSLLSELAHLLLKLYKGSAYVIGLLRQNVLRGVRHLHHRPWW